MSSVIRNQGEIFIGSLAKLPGFSAFCHHLVPFQAGDRRAGRPGDQSHREPAPHSVQPFHQSFSL